MHSCEEKNDYCGDRPSYLYCKKSTFIIFDESSKSQLVKEDSPFVIFFTNNCIFKYYLKEKVGPKRPIGESLGMANDGEWRTVQCLSEGVKVIVFTQGC